MELYYLPEDLSIMYVTAKTFPEGIMPAFQIIKDLFGDTRPLFGLSKPVNNSIVYRAGALETSFNEAANYNLETFTLAKGVYLSETITDWINNVPQIAQTFDNLLADPRLDPAAYCVEWYKGDGDALCMVKLLE